jgi:hypothetical protein
MFDGLEQLKTLSNSAEATRSMLIRPMGCVTRSMSERQVRCIIARRPPRPGPILRGPERGRLLSADTRGGGAGAIAAIGLTFECKSNQRSTALEFIEKSDLMLLR